MSEYTEVEQPFLQQLATLGWQTIDQGQGIPSDPAQSLRTTFRQWLLPNVFSQAIAALNTVSKGGVGTPWLTAKQLQDLQDQILRQPNRTLLEANEAIQKLLFKAQVDTNEQTGEQDPVVTLIDFAHQIAAQPTVDLDSLKKIRFLKAAVVISGDGTNEAAYITAARKQAKAWDAVNNFCKAFDFEDPDQVNTGIAFLVVCDMLLTGFDAPIEQVMYLDKKIKEHTLLQAIARTNRVKKGKTRGYIVDYIGLTENLTDALTLYAAADEQQELALGLKSIASEMPILEERYQRLLQLFATVPHLREYTAGTLPTPEADAAVIHAAVKRLKDERRRIDFDVYLKKFLTSLDIILPNAIGHPYRVPAKRLGYLLRVTKERYKDTSLDLGDAGQKVKDLINQHLISLGINPKVPPVELLSTDFIDQLNQHAAGNLEAKASEMEHAIRKHCMVHHDEDPAFYRSLSQKVENLIDQYQDQWEKLAEELAKLRTEAIAGRQPGEDGMSTEATPFYAHIANEAFAGVVPAPHQPRLKALMEAIVEILQESIGSIDFWNNSDKRKKTRSKIKTALTLTGIVELKEQRDRLAIEIMKLAKNRHDELLKTLGDRS